MGTRSPRHFFKKKFKVDFSIGKSISVKLKVNSFNDKFSLILGNFVLFVYFVPFFY